MAPPALPRPPPTGPKALRESYLPLSTRAEPFKIAIPVKLAAASSPSFPSRPNGASRPHPDLFANGSTSIFEPNGNADAGPSRLAGSSLPTRLPSDPRENDHRVDGYGYGYDRARDVQDRAHGRDWGRRERRDRSYDREDGRGDGDDRRDDRHARDRVEHRDYGRDRDRDRGRGRDQRDRGWERSLPPHLARKDARERGPPHRSPETARHPPSPERSKATVSNRRDRSPLSIPNVLKAHAPISIALPASVALPAKPASRVPVPSCLLDRPAPSQPSHPVRPEQSISNEVALTKADTKEPEDSPPPPPPDVPPPPSPTARPATRPLPPSVPPPPPSDEPPAPPTVRVPSPPPPPSSRPPTPPLVSRPPSPPPPAPLPSSRVQPPAFHFRDLNTSKRDGSRLPSSPAIATRAPPTGPRADRWDVKNAARTPAQPPSALAAEARAPTPPPPPSPPPAEPAEPVEPVPTTESGKLYVPPPSVFRRPGNGNFNVLYDPASDKGKKGKEVVKRFDGEVNGKIIEVSDPRLRLSVDARQRGSGAAKNRPGFYEVSYTWDDATSVGTKPPPPPTAVLITALNPLTTSEQIASKLRVHGRIKELSLKTDQKSGMALGICWVKFEGPAKGKTGTAHDVANAVVKACDGMRFGLRDDERAKVVLDGRGLRCDQAVKDEMAKRYPPKAKAPPPQPKAAPTASTGAPTPLAPAATTSSGDGETPRELPRSRPPVPILPNRPRPGGVPHDRLLDRFSHLNSTSMRSPVPVPRAHAFPSLPARPTQDLSRAFAALPPSFRRNGVDTYVPGDRTPRSYSSYSSDSDDSLPPYRRRSRSPLPSARFRGRVPAKSDKEANEAALEETRKALLDNKHPCIFIDASSLPPSTAIQHVRDHFRAFRPTRVLANYTGWHILFSDGHSAVRAAAMLNQTLVQGRKIAPVVRNPVTKKDAGAAEQAAAADGGVTKQPSWKLLTFAKRRPTVPVRPARRLPSPKRRHRQRSYSSSSDSDDDRPAIRRRVVESSDSDSDGDVVRKPVRLVVKSPSPEKKAEERMDVDEPATQEVKGVPVTNEAVTAELVPEVVVQPDADNEAKAAKSKKRPAKPKAAKKSKKAKIDIAVAVEPAPTPEVAEITVAPAEPPAEAQADDMIEVKPAAAPKKKAPADPFNKLVATGVIKDDEDAYWLAQALVARDGPEPPGLDDEDESAIAPTVDSDHPLYHTSGSWRAEGLRKVPQALKSAYLPQRNRAAIVADTAAAAGGGGASGAPSGRTARVTGRRLALDMETHRKSHRAAGPAAAAATEQSDVFAFNQLRIRKKHLRFARSAIEGYGLYAVETIQPGEMVCEYVGEVIRSAVAEVREQRYLKQGIGSSYLFRIDGDVVCDATFTGSVSRLINHSCDPSASAKIISINGHSKIVIYARRTLHPGEEILYDYKFPLESDESLRVPCLCGAATCRKYLN